MLLSVPAALADFTSLAAMQRHAIVPNVITYSAAIGPAVPADLTSPTGDAAPYHGAQRGYLQRCQLCMQGPAAPVGLTSLTSDAAPCPCAGGDSLQCVAMPPSVRTKRISITGGPYSPYE